MIRSKSALHWVSEEMGKLRSATSANFRIRIFVTREDSMCSTQNADGSDNSEGSKALRVSTKEINKLCANADAIGVGLTTSMTSPVEHEDGIGMSQYFSIS